jgi:hypothetical protein
VSEDVIASSRNTIDGAQLEAAEDDEDDDDAFDVTEGDAESDDSEWPDDLDDDISSDYKM